MSYEMKIWKNYLITYITVTHRGRPSSSIGGGLMRMTTIDNHHLRENPSRPLLVPAIGMEMDHVRMESRLDITFCTIFSFSLMTQ